jgi:RNA polymerase sigma-70 factor, ECF subfamily
MTASVTTIGDGESISTQGSFEKYSLEEFLASAETRAYRAALMTTKKSADALDIVQDAMTQLVQYYRHKESREWPLLFQRILQNKMMDWYRSNSRQKRWFASVPTAFEDDEEDFFDSVVDHKSDNPLEMMERTQQVSHILDALETLPLRQRQAFLLRAWEGFDVAETATAMGCSEGSVKTHYFRALQAMREFLKPSP